MAAPTILIVEDQALLREVMALELGDAGYGVLEAETGTEALALLGSGARVDLLFTDIRLPGEIDGFSVAEEARRLRPHLPVVYATGYTGDTLRLVPGGRFFRKPYQPEAILKALRDLGIEPA